MISSLSLSSFFFLQSLLYKNAKDASHRSRLSSEMMIYHMTVNKILYTGDVFDFP